MFSDTLRTVQLPIVSDNKCIREQPRAFRKYVTPHFALDIEIISLL